MSAVFYFYFIFVFGGLLVMSVFVFSAVRYFQEEEDEEKQEVFSSRSKSSAITSSKVTK